MIIRLEKKLQCRVFMGESESLDSETNNNTPYRCSLWQEEAENQRLKNQKSF